MASVGDSREAEDEVSAVAPTAVASPSGVTGGAGPARVLALQSAIGNAAVVRGARPGAAGRPLPAAPLTASDQAALDAGGAALREAVLARRAAEGEAAATPRTAHRAPGGAGLLGESGAGQERRVDRRGRRQGRGGRRRRRSQDCRDRGRQRRLERHQSIWDGAKAAGQWAVDWLSKAGSAVWDALKWFGSGAWTIIKGIGTYLWEKLSLLGSLCLGLHPLLPLPPLAASSSRAGT